MQATHSDVFALKKSGFDAFLYADVGAEANGSTLTILSILARLGKDPWVEAARWAALPKSAAVDSLAQSIAEMPLMPSALAGARDSAVRLVQLLPANPLSLQQGSASLPATAMPKEMPIAILYCVFAVWMALTVLLTSKLSSDVAAPIERSTTTPEAAHTVTGSIKKDAVVGPSVAPNRQ